MIMQFEFDDLFESEDRQGEMYDDSMSDDEPVQRLRGGCPDNDDTNNEDDVYENNPGIVSVDEKPVVFENHHGMELHDCKSCHLCNEESVTMNRACHTEGCDDNQSSDINNSTIIPCNEYNSPNGYCKWGTN